MHRNISWKSSRLVTIYHNISQHIVYHKYNIVISVAISSFGTANAALQQLQNSLIAPRLHCSKLQPVIKYLSHGSGPATCQIRAITEEAIR